MPHRFKLLWMGTKNLAAYTVSFYNSVKLGQMFKDGSFAYMESWTVEDWTMFTWRTLMGLGGAVLLAYQLRNAHLTNKHLKKNNGSS